VYVCVCVCVCMCVCARARANGAIDKRRQHAASACHTLQWERVVTRSSTSLAQVLLFRGFVLSFFLTNKCCFACVGHG